MRGIQYILETDEQNEHAVRDLDEVLNALRRLANGTAFLTLRSKPLADNTVFIQACWNKDKKAGFFDRMRGNVGRYQIEVQKQNPDGNLRQYRREIKEYETVEKIFSDYLLEQKAPDLDAWEDITSELPHLRKEKAEELPLSQEIVQEVEEALSFVVHSGFYSKEEMFSEVEQIFEDICLDYNVPCPSKAYIHQTVERLLSEGRQERSGQNNYCRLRNVFDTLNRERIISIHFAGYTQDEGFEEVGTIFQFMKGNNIPRKGYCFYHQQDIERAMDPKSRLLYLAFYSMDGNEQIALEVGERIKELLTQSGFQAEWDGSLKSRIAIRNFLWDKEYDGEDYGTDRAIRIMRESNW